MLISSSAASSACHVIWIGQLSLTEGGILRALAVDAANKSLDDRVESIRDCRLSAEFKLASSFPDLDAQDARSVTSCAVP